MVIVPFLLLYPFYPFCYCTLFVTVTLFTLFVTCAVFVIVSCLLLRRFCCCTLFVFITVPFLLLYLLLYPFCNPFFVTVPLFVTVPFSLTSGTRSSPVTALSDVTLCVGEKAHAAMLCRQCNFSGYLRRLHLIYRPQACSERVRLLRMTAGRAPVLSQRILTVLESKGSVLFCSLGLPRHLRDLVVHACSCELSSINKIYWPRAFSKLSEVAQNKYWLCTCSESRANNT